MTKAQLTATTLCSLLALVGNPAYGLADCEYANLSRSIDVVYETPNQPVPCAVRYVKHDEGVESTPWQARNEAGYCEDKAEALRQTLVDLGWQCQARTTSETSVDG